MVKFKFSLVVFFLELSSVFSFPDLKCDSFLAYLPTFGRARNGSTHRQKHWRLCPRPSQITTIYLFGVVFLVDLVILFFFSSSMIQFLFLSALLNSAMANQSSSTQWSNPWWTEKQAPSGLKMPLEASQKEISKMAWCLSPCPPPTITRQSKTLNMCLPSTSQIPISYTADQRHHRRDPLSRSTTTLTLSRTTLLKWRRWVQRTGTKVDDRVGATDEYKSRR